MQFAAAHPPASYEIVQEVYTKCHRLKQSDTSPFGTAKEWLRKATAAGHPIAQATTGTDFLISNRVNAMGATGPRQGAVADLPDGSFAERQAIATALLRQALKSKKPDVFVQVADAQSLIRGPGKATANEVKAWLLLACQKGFDCSESAIWYRDLCNQDPRSLCQPGETAMDMFKRDWGNDYLEIEERAKQIDAMLEAGRYEELIPNPQ